MSVATVGVVGAGTMGAGIAQLACLGGFETHLHDPDPAALARGAGRLRADLARGAERGRWAAAQAAAAAARLQAEPRLDGLAGCELVVEAAPEELELKRRLLAELEAICAPAAILTTNTSSLPVGELAAGLRAPQRFCGMHFFNPPALMRLVEVVAGERTAEATAAQVAAVAERMGRTAIRCADLPGFVVNRCNRPFFGESLRILGAGVAGHEAIDAAIREAGYRIGPFELIDLIGLDVNLEVARSFYRQRPLARWRPHPIQERLVAAGRLGRKAGRGFYRYDAEGTKADPPEPDAEPALRRAIGERVLAQLINEACFAAGEAVAAPDQIDAAMRLGLNHPRGPFAWAERLGAGRVVEILAELEAAGEEDVYAPAPQLLRLAAQSG